MQIFDVRKKLEKDKSACEICERDSSQDLLLKSRISGKSICISCLVDISIKLYNKLKNEPRKD